jgi:hypothetical protein
MWQAVLEAMGDVFFISVLAEAAEIEGAGLSFPRVTTFEYSSCGLYNFRCDLGAAAFYEGG